MFVGVYWPRNAGWEQCGVNGAGEMYGTGTKDGKAFVDCWEKSTKRFGLYGGGPGDSANRYAAALCHRELPRRLRPRQRLHLSRKPSRRGRDV